MELCKNIHGSNIHNSQKTKAKTNQMPKSSGMEAQILIYPHSVILFSKNQTNKEIKPNDTLHIMDVYKKPYVAPKNSLYTPIGMKYRDRKSEIQEVASLRATYWSITQRNF